MRHAPYVVSQVMRDECMHCMTQAITEQGANLVFRAWLIGTFAQMADHTINTDSSQGCQHSVS
jgi:hemoglobin